MSSQEPLVGFPSELDCVLDLAPAQVANRLASWDWDLSDAASDELSHALHPYPAKFVPALPRQLILALSRSNDLVLDPFSGGGTTGVEALAAGRSAYLVDANPVGNAIARAKTTTLEPLDLSELRRLEMSLLSLDENGLTEREPSWLPEIPNLEKWYDSKVFVALGTVRERVMKVARPNAQALALVSFIQAASRLSYQDSETRYSSRPRVIQTLEVPRTVVGELRRMMRVAQALGQVDSRCSIEIVDGDARLRSTYELAGGSVGLVATSPPYPNAYDYHLYHRFRLFWLGSDPRDLRRVEIGSHLKNQSELDPEGRYAADMEQVLRHCAELLSPGRYAAFVVGDGLFKGEVYPTSEELAELGIRVGLEHVLTITRNLPVNRRSVTKPGRRLTQEQIVILRRPRSFGFHVEQADIVNPNYRLFDYERELQVRELNALGSGLGRNASGDPASGRHDELLRAAFIHGLREPDGDLRVTYQAMLERPQPGDSKRKNSTYLTHGLHRYKGKFYPQLAKCLMNLAPLEPGSSLVVDPFGGSGTVALEAILNGLDAVSLDTNPLAVSIAKAKVAAATAEPKILNDALEKIGRAVQEAPVGSSTCRSFHPGVVDELERWFPIPVLAKLDWLLACIRKAGVHPAVELCEVLTSDLLREVSHQDPRDLRIRRRSEPLADAPVYELFLARLTQMRARLDEYWKVAEQLPPRGTAHIVQTDSRDATSLKEALRGRRIDAVVSSPPYAAALPYIDTDRLSLAALLGLTSRNRRRIEEITVGSREITERERQRFVDALTSEEPDQLPPSTLRFLRDYAAAIDAFAEAGFRLRQAPAVLTRYFLNIHAVLTNVVQQLAPAGTVAFVLGDSRSTVAGRTWQIPTVAETEAIASTLGLELIERLEISVTREDGVHSRHAITHNEILRFRLAS